MKKLIIFYMLAVAMLIALHINRDVIEKIHTKPEIYLQTISNFLTHNFNQKSYVLAYFRLVTGIPTKLHYKISDAISHLYLWILFSNNGLHLFLFSSLFFSKKKSRIPNLLMALTLRPFSSIRKLTSMFIRKVFLRYEQKNFETHTFYITFFILLVYAFYFDKYISYVYSFLFIGTYYFTAECTRLYRFIFLMITTILICIYSQTSFSFLGLIFSTAFIFVFKKSYPVFVLVLLLTTSLSKFLIFQIIPKYFFELLISFSNIASIDSTNSTTLLLVLLIVSVWRQNFRYLIFFFFIHAEPVSAPAIFYSR